MRKVKTLGRRSVKSKTPRKTPKKLKSSLFRRTEVVDLWAILSEFVDMLLQMKQEQAQRQASL